MKQKIKPDFERFMTALHCEAPDRVPLGDWSIHPSLMEQFIARKLKTPQDQLDFRQAAGFDFVAGLSGIFEMFRTGQRVGFQAETSRNLMGEEVTRDWANEHEGVIKDWEQFEQFPWPSADDFDLSVWDTFDKILPPGMKAVLVLGKIYTPVWMLMGAERFFNALKTDEQLVSALFERVGRIQYETFLRVIEHPGVGAVTNPDDIAHNTGLLIHPAYLRKYIFPWYKKMGDVCRDRGLGFIFHSDGDCTEIMDDLIDCGFHAFNPVQPNCMDIAAVKQKWGQKLCLIGNINLDSTLTLGSPEDVRAEVYERIRTIGPGGGYMVASSNSIPDYVPFDNMTALFDATLEFGGYPIDLQKGAVSGNIWTFQGKPGAETASFQWNEAAAEDYLAAFLSNHVDRVVELTEQAMHTDLSLPEVINRGMIPAMAAIGEKFQNGEIYIPEMIIAANTMSAALGRFKDLLASGSGHRRGIVIIGTVKGDLHDIGKNLVAMMLERQGFSVKDLGVSVTTEQFVHAVKQKHPDVLAMSALLTTTMVEMKNTIDALSDAGLRDSVKLIVGGAPLTQEFANRIGADGYAYDAPGAAKICQELLGQ